MICSSGKTGIASTFINRDSKETVLLDLKHLLKEASQKVPPILNTIPDPSDEWQEVDGIVGCGYCGTSSCQCARTSYI